MRSIIRNCIIVLILAIDCCASFKVSAQEMSLNGVISKARDNSVLALQAKASFISDYWAYRSYRASLLPSLSLYGTVGAFDRSLTLLQSPETGELKYATSYNMQNSIGLMASQNIGLTGGKLSLYSDLSRIDQFGTNPGKTWYAQPVTLSYSQPIFSFNQFKWSKKISPKEYEKAKKVYLESMEDVTVMAAEYYFSLMLSNMVYDASVENYHNTSSMLSVAEQRTSLGSVTRDEYLQLQLRQLNDSISINENYVALKEARMHLNSLLGFDETYSIVPVLDESLPDIVMDYELVLRKCSSNSSFYLDNTINVLNAEAAVEKAKADRGITMQLNARFGLTNSNPEFVKTYQNLLA